MRSWRKEKKNTLGCASWQQSPPGGPGPWGHSLHRTRQALNLDSCFVLYLQWLFDEVALEDFIGVFGPQGLFGAWLLRSQLLQGHLWPVCLLTSLRPSPQDAQSTIPCTLYLYCPFSLLNYNGQPSWTPAVLFSNKPFSLSPTLGERVSLWRVKTLWMSDCVKEKV